MEEWLKGISTITKYCALSEMPKVETHWILSQQIWGGISQQVTSAVQPALTNAIYDAGGPRIRSLPLKNHKIRKRGRDTSVE